MAQGPRVDDVCRAHGLVSRGSERRALGLGVWQSVSSGNSGLQRPFEETAVAGFRV